MERELERSECPACGPAPSQLWMDDGLDTKYVRCLTCRTVFADPRLAKITRHNRIKDEFAASDEAHATMASRAKALAFESSKLRGLIPRGRVLDVGCGVGGLLAHFPTNDWERVGVEISPSAAAVARQLLGIHIHEGTLTDFDVPEESFDVISLIDVLYYSDNPAEELRKAQTLVRPKGIVAVEVAGHSYQLLRSRGVLSYLLDGKWSRLQTDAHLYWFSPQAILALLRRADLQVKEIIVVPSPKSASRLHNLYSGVHLRLMSVAAALHPYFLAWAPKYLVIAERP